MPTLADGREAIEQGNLQQARLIFEAILQESPRTEEAWLGLAEVLTDNEDKRVCYENALKINKNNQTAKEGLRNLEPQANPFVTALRQKSSPGPEGAEQEEDEMGGEEYSEEFEESGGVESTAAEDGPASYTLVALGLLLSVIVFAVGGGIAFFVLNSLNSG